MRALLVALGIAFTASAGSAQDDRQFQAGREADFDQWRWAQTQRARALTEGERAVQAVTEAMVKRDCTAAAAALNAGLAKQHPEVWLLAGAMFEDGLCLKPNWDRAVNFYQRADSAGQPAAALRLVQSQPALRQRLQANSRLARARRLSGQRQSKGQQTAARDPDHADPATAGGGGDGGDGVRRHTVRPWRRWPPCRRRRSSA